MNWWWQYIGSRDFYDNFIITLIVSALLSFLGILFKLAKLILIFKKSQDVFSLSGVWISPEFDSYIRGKKNIEVVYIKQQGDDVKLTIFQYTNRGGKNRYKGKGVVKGGVLVAFYSILRGGSVQCGVFVLKIDMDPKKVANPILHGKYMEMRSATGAIVSNKYKIEKVELGFINRLRFLVSLSIISDFESAKKIRELLSK